MTDHPANHLDPETIAAFVDGRLGAHERSAVEGHLSGCPACRHEIVAVQELVGSYRPAPSRLRVLVPLAAAAVVALAVGLPALRGGGEDRQDAPVRRPEVESAGTLAVVSPAPGAAIAPGASVEFTWRLAEAGSTYRLTVVDAVGGIVWSAETGDTSVTMPAGTALARGRTYYWYVDALRSDGSSQTTGAQPLTVP